MTRTALTSLAASLVILLVGAGSYLYLSSQQNNTDTGTVPIGGPFELTSEDGSRVTEADFAGKSMLLYFGYTYCPDICPIGLATLSAAYDQLPSTIQAKVEPVFITVDPVRDTVEVVAEYADLFHDDLIGLTGSVEDIEKTKTTFRVYAKKVGNDPTDYLVDHATFTYLIGPDGMYQAHFNHSDTAETIAAGIIEITQ